MLKSPKYNKLLCVTEAELDIGIDSVHGILLGMRVLQSIGLDVSKPVTLYNDNKEDVDYSNNLSSSGRM